jgi:hypothetical protein
MRARPASGRTSAMKTTETRVKQNPASTHEQPYQPDAVEAKWQALWD